MPALRTLYLSSDLPMEHKSLHDFRAMIAQFEGTKNPLIYNRDENGVPGYEYPVIQFRCNDGFASVFAINEGALFIEKIIKKKLPFDITRIERDSFQLKKVTKNHTKFYHLFRWIPLDERYFSGISDSDGSFKLWNELFMDEKVKLLENILVSNIIDFAHCVGWQISKNKSLRIRLHDIQHINPVKLYGSSVIAFDVTYAANLELPDHLGLGRGKSMGYGWQLLSIHNDVLKKGVLQSETK